MIDPLTQQLFGQYPREVANPSRAVIHDEVGLETFLIYNEGVHDCYTSVYPLSGEIDKIFFDFDGYGRALEDAKKVYLYLVERGHVVVPVASGKKGIHLYILLVPKEYENPKEKLTSSAYSILIDVFGEDEYNKTTADPHIIGDLRRITRIPNTRRPPYNNSWCTYLPPEFVKAKWLNIINWTKMPHHMDRVAYPTKTLDDFSTPNIKIEAPQMEYPTSPIPTNTNFILEGTLRPCLYRAIMQPSPRHMVRVASTIDLLMFWSPNDIGRIYASLSWVDFDHSTTITQIKSCEGLKPYSCRRKLIPAGICLVKDISDCPLRDNNVSIEAMVGK